MAAELRHQSSGGKRPWAERTFVASGKNSEPRLWTRNRLLWRHRAGFRQGGRQYGIRQTFLHDGQTNPSANEWGALAAWAWGLSRIVDYLETDRNVDAKKIVLTGFSRLGKAAMWSAAQDARYAVVIAVNREWAARLYIARPTAETIEHLNDHAFPLLVRGEFSWHTGHPDQVPVDGHMLLA